LAIFSIGPTIGSAAFLTSTSPADTANEALTSSRVAMRVKIFFIIAPEKCQDANA
jgi:hypothetical protein